MRVNMDKLVQVASKIRTPLALSGITVVALYAIYKQVLSLNVFDNIGANSTFLLLQSILDRLFWLALISIFLGVLSYLIVVFLGRKLPSLSSDVDLLDSALDPSDSLYEQKQKSRRKIIRPKQEILKGEIGIDKIHESQYHFPTVDFKFQNTGSATAFLWRFAIIILHYEIDVTPVLDFKADIQRDGLLRITVKNNGWGVARNCNIQVSERTLDKLFSSSARQFLGTINSGESKTIFEFSREQMNETELAFLHEEFTVLDFGQQGGWARDRYNNQDTMTGIELKPFQVKWICKDENDCNAQGEQNIIYHSYFFLTSAGFIEVVLPPSLPRLKISDTTYVVVIDPSKNEQELAYPISREIPSGDVERFHIMLGATKSCNLLVKFRFYIDKGKTVESDEFSINIWNPRNSRITDFYKDGEQLKREVEELKNQVRVDCSNSWEQERKQRRLESAQRQASNYPFIESRED